MGKIYIIFVLMQLAAIATADHDICDTSKCPQIPKHYEEMGCEAVKSPGDCCVRR